MEASVITLATATPRPWEPWDDTDTKFGTRQRIWHYSRNQQTRRHLEKPPQFRKEKKAVKPFIGLPDKPTDQWMCHAGEQPWPHYWSHPPEDAFRSLWVLEGEGEKVADYAASAGFVCISHPGHNRTDEAILRRHRELKEMVAGVVYLADADRQGAALGRRLKDAALFVGLPFIGIDMGVAFPDLPKGGSLDDVPDVGAAIEQILAGVNENPPVEASSSSLSPPWVHACSTTSLTPSFGWRVSSRALKRRSGSDGVSLVTTSQRTGGWHGRQPVFFMVFHASMALCRSIRRRVSGTGGLGGTQL